MLGVTESQLSKRIRVNSVLLPLRVIRFLYFLFTEASELSFSCTDIFQLTIEVDEGDEDLLQLLKTKFSEAEVLHQAQTQCKTQKPVNCRTNGKYKIINN